VSIKKNAHAKNPKWVFDQRKSGAVAHILLTRFPKLGNSMNTTLLTSPAIANHAMKLRHIDFDQ
jgi:hypothetical protein